MRDSAYYVPHHCEIKPDVTITKLRVVFIASKKTTRNTSLNDMLYPGLILQKDIDAVLLRSWKSIVSAHLWSFDFNDTPLAYDLNTVTYGVNSASYLTLRTIKKLAEDGRDQYPLTARSLEEDTYVADIITGTRTVSLAIKLQADLIDILTLDGFQLHKCAKNYLCVLRDIPLSERQVQNIEFDLDRDQTVDSWITVESG